MGCRGALERMVGLVGLVELGDLVMWSGGCRAVGCWWWQGHGHGHCRWGGRGLGLRWLLHALHGRCQAETEASDESPGRVVLVFDERLGVRNFGIGERPAALVGEARDVVGVVEVVVVKGSGMIRGGSGGGCSSGCSSSGGPLWRPSCQGRAVVGGVL